MQVFVDAMQAL